MSSYLQMEDSRSGDDVACCGLRCCRRKRVPSAETSSEHLAKEEFTKSVFSGDLPQPLLPGHCIQVSGAPLDHCTRFAVNFTCGKTPDSDIAFHFNPRLEQKYVVRNARLGGHWGTEETVSCHRCELPRATPFTLAFFVSPREFLVSVNGRHFCTFATRTSMDRMRFVEVHGEVSVASVQVHELSQYPPVCQPADVPIKVDTCHARATATLPNPFVGHLPQGFRPGWQLEVSGKVKLLPHSFYVNLQDGAQYWPHPDIPLHLDSRFNTQVSTHSLVRNAWVNGAWGPEERSPACHFVPGRSFRLVIRMEAEHFGVWVNGRLEGEFRFRTSANAVDTVYIQGDLVLYEVSLNKQVANALVDKFKQ